MPTSTSPNQPTDHPTPREERPLRVALVGLGDIAVKAYLPVLAARADVEPVLVTRDPSRLAQLAAAHRVAETYPDLDRALAVGLDAAFVHAATAAHPPLVAALLEAGVPVHVDKPLADSAAGAAALVALAERSGVGLMVGFNRRYAPAYRAVAGWPELDTVVLHKHRAGLPGAPRSVIFDDFVHVLDTLRFLATPDPETVRVSARVRDGRLHRVAVWLEQAGRLAVGIMDRDSGSTEEVLEALAPGRRTRVVELAEVTEHAGGQMRLRRRDEWVPVSTQRGFTALVDTFLAGVRSGERLDARDALATHELCERVLAELSEGEPDGDPRVEARP